jgi:predicted dehydrogenase
VTQYHFPGGPVVHAEGSWLLAEGFKMAYTMQCERATLDYDLARCADALIITETGQPPRVVELEGTDGYANEINYFIDCVANRQPPCIVTAREGVTALEICEAEETSIHTGALIKL